MTFTLNAPMFDYLVLAVIRQHDTYGYEISQTIKSVSDTKDSTLYPVLKRLQDQHLVTTYNQEYQGRNRKYYSITQEGTVRYEEMCMEWDKFTNLIHSITEGSQV
ncbi:MAG: PadR family transcriptional regulator [Lachnospiraceae bacterium]|jgi:PadR family transcriptional regulator PadR|nr:PadR family transcriptional regulator [Lachnospiraceae bacterium]MDD3615326.1 PadR family transcriptional regulator [Lachnospiraceae bacterium]